VTDPAAVYVLDQAIIDAGRALANAELERPRDPQKIADLRQALIDARKARGWPYA
jgi:hypothetical protein